MKVTLRTRCGCERSLNVPYPPPPHILVALSQATCHLYLDLDAEELRAPRCDDTVRMFVRFHSYDPPIYVEKV